MKPTLQNVAADIARRIPAMKTDSSLNNEQLIAGIIEPLLEQQDEESDKAKSETLITAFLFGCVIALLLLFAGLAFAFFFYKL